MDCDNRVILDIAESSSSEESYDKIIEIAPERSSLPSKKLSHEQRSLIVAKHNDDPSLKQADLARWAVNEFGLESLSQATISSILTDLQVSKIHGNLTNGQKEEICKHHTKFPRTTQKQLAKWAMEKFNLAKAPTQPTISNILKNKLRFLEKVAQSDKKLKRERKLKSVDLDKRLLTWILHCQDRKIALSGQTIQMKAKEIAQGLQIPANNLPTFSEGWLWKFQKRHGLRSLKFSGERGSADLEAVKQSLPEFRSLIEQYHPSDVFNMDETGLFFCMAPDRTIATRQLEGCKKAMTRMTVALTANSNGTEKLEPLFIGKSKQPRAFRRKSSKQLGILYHSNQSAWMTALIFQDWLKKLDAKMSRAKRNILLLLDNAPSHIVTNLELVSITVTFLPPNTTSVMQPMDAGIIAAFKKRYRHFQVQSALLAEAVGTTNNIYKVDILQAIRWCQDAWQMIQPSAIENCWRHTGLVLGDVASLASSTDYQQIDEELQACLSKLQPRNPMCIEEFVQPAIELDLVHEEIDILEDNFEQVIDTDSGDDDLEQVDFNTLLTAFRTVTSYLNQQPNADLETLRSLNKYSYDIVCAERQNRLDSLHQTDIRSYFK